MPWPGHSVTHGQIAQQYNNTWSIPAPVLQLSRASNEGSRRLREVLQSQSRYEIETVMQVIMAIRHYANKPSRNFFAGDPISHLLTVG